MPLDRLCAAAATIGINLTEQQLARFEVYARELQTWNPRLNLTRIDERAGIEIRHFVDSLSCALPVVADLRAGAIGRCIDVGSGGGFPGVPLAIAFPAIEVTLLEATEKKAGFLRHLVDFLPLPGVSVLVDRAETAARESAYREVYHLVVARALAPLPVALELCLPFARVGGRAVLPRGSDLEAQLEDGECAACELGGRLLLPRPLDGLGLPAGRALAIAEKIAPTDSRFPRRPGIAAKRPLHCPKLPIA